MVSKIGTSNRPQLHSNGAVQTSQLNSFAAYTKKLPDPQLIYVIDFFSGCGGISWAFASTRQSHTAFKILGGIDIDPKAIATYELNVKARGIEKDIAEIAEDPEVLKRIVPTFDPSTCRPLVFIGCPPCQGFSAHRKKDVRDDPRNNLIAAFAEICCHYEPDVIIMENVPEIITGRFREYFRTAAKLLEKSGYSLTIDVLDLSLYGIAQKRRRAIVFGSRRGIIEMPAPIFSRESALTVRHAISHLSEILSGTVDPHDPDHRAPAHTQRILTRIKRTPADGGDRRALSSDEQLNCHVSLDNGPTPGFTDVYGRLRWDTPSVTITAKSSTPSCGRFLHPEQNRNISVREAAILQGFPQSFAFVGPLVHQYRLIGEAVPPLFGRVLAWQILDHFRPRTKNINELSHRSHFLGTYDRTGSSGLKVVDCFCGAGGIALGFEAAGFDTAYAFDVDEDCVKTFRRNIPTFAEKKDVRDSDVAKSILGTVDNHPFVLVGGPPCQGFSQQRRGQDFDPRNNLILRYADLVAALPRKPLAIVLENVVYLDSPRGRRIMSEYVKRLEALGYRIFRHDLNSADYGVPQLRWRIIIVGLLEELAGEYKGPLPFTAGRWPTVGESLAGLSDPSDPSLLGSMFLNHEASREGELNRRRIAYVDMGKGRTAIPAPLQLDCHTKYNGHLDVYGRLDWFSQARTITAGFDSFTRGEFGHPFFHRSITPREAARLQGFPDWFVFEGNRASVRRQIGNAVPPPLACALGKAIFDAVRRAERGI